MVDKKNLDSKKKKDRWLKIQKIFKNHNYIRILKIKHIYENE